ncbi:MAG: S-formylglutathione hydrolase [Rhodobacteraceae bacterium]|nr:S-formylglutathione hydrolase [Paracoccaceae bacterium]
METLSEKRAFGGIQGEYRHASAATGGDMTFGLFMPTAAKAGKVPLLWFLGGLTCTHENAMVKAGAQQWAEECGLALAFPDTSPRGADVANDDAFDLGQGAGFYVNATQAPWAPHFSMWDYVGHELPALIGQEFGIDMDRQAITGHSMGGHGALTLAMGLKGRFRSVSAFSPICQPTQSDWGCKQFTAYLGDDRATWLAHDATHLMQAQGFDGPMLVDTGAQDEWSALLNTQSLADAFTARGQQGAFRLQEGYDHSYFFVSTFLAEHVRFHAAALKA